MTDALRDRVGHTEGPWKIGNGDIYADGNKLSDFDDRVICAIGKSGGFRSHEHSVIRANSEEGRANAYLIAAAPTTLNALINLEAYLRLTAHHNAPEAAAARQAIREALGDFA